MIAKTSFASAELHSLPFVIRFKALVARLPKKVNPASSDRESSLGLRDLHAHTLLDRSITFQALDGREIVPCSEIALVLGIDILNGWNGSKK